MPPSGDHSAACRLLRREEVRAVSVVAFEGLNRHPHLLADGAAQEATHRVWLPTGRFRELRQRDAAGPLEQVKNLVRFGAAVGRDSGPFRASNLRSRVSPHRRGLGAWFGNARLRRRRYILSLFLGGHFIGLPLAAVAA